MKPSTPRPDSGRRGEDQRSDTPGVISLLTDYGLADGFVGALHSVLRSRLPLVPIVDLTHGVPTQDVRAGSLALKRAGPYLAAGVVLAIVDPGVGTARRSIALSTGAADVIFVGPDNGLMLPALDTLGGPALGVELENLTYQLAAPGPTFARPDIFAPAAAFLAGGGPWGNRARPRPGEPRTPPGAAMPAPGQRPGGGGDLGGQVRQRAIGRRPRPPRLRPQQERSSDSHKEPTSGDIAEPWAARVVHTYGDLAPGELGLLVDSYGCLALCQNGARAADRLAIQERDVVWLEPPVAG